MGDVSGAGTPARLYLCPAMSARITGTRLLGTTITIWPGDLNAASSSAAAPAAWVEPPGVDTGVTSGAWTLRHRGWRCDGGRSAIPR